MTSQIVTSSRRKLAAPPYAFTEQAWRCSRVCCALRAQSKSTSPYDEQFAVVFDAIKRLIAEDDARRASPRRRIGFMA